MSKHSKDMQSNIQGSMGTKTETARRNIGLTEEGKARLGKASDFFFEVLLPHVKSDGNFTIEKLSNWMRDFKRDNKGLGSDFELSHVWGIAYKQAVINKHVLAKSNGDLRTNKDIVLKALEILTKA